MERYASRALNYYWDLITIGLRNDEERHDFSTESLLGRGNRFPIEHGGELVTVEVEKIEPPEILDRPKVTARVLA